MKTVPRHVAIIMDGNGRWAVMRKKPRFEGHIKGISAVRRVINAADDIGIKYLTLYSFSSENWKRPKKEILFLFRLMEDNLRKEMSGLHENNVKVRFSGRLDALPENLRDVINEIESLTSANTGLNLIFAINYGGRQEILDAVSRMAACGKNKKPVPEEFRRFLYLPDVSDPDLVIRTAGEKRLSNFLTWQSVYSELYFTGTLWPDFGVTDLKKACKDYERRVRRFGGL